MTRDKAQPNASTSPLQVQIITRQIHTVMQSTNSQCSWLASSNFQCNYQSQSTAHRYSDEIQTNVFLKVQIPNVFFV